MANDTKSNFTSNFTNVQLEKAPTILTAVLITTGFWIIVINVLVFSCLITSRSAKKSYVNLQLLSLSVTDMLVGAFSIPVTLTFKITGSFPTYGVCASLFYLYVASQAATLNHALVICVRRLITVKRKTHNNFVIKSKYLSVFLEIVFVWTVSFVIISIPFLAYGRFGERLSSCSLNTLFADNYASAIGIFTSCLLIPHVCLNVVYLYMLVYLKRKWKQINVKDNGLSAKRVAKDNSGRPSAQTITPIEVIDHGSLHTKLSSRPDNDSNACGSTMKLNNLEVNRYQTTRLGGIRTDASSVGSTIISPSLARSSQIEQIPGKSCETLNGRKTGPPSRLGGIDGQKRVLVTIGILLVILNVFMTPLSFLTLFEFLHKGYLSRSVKFVFMNMAILNSALNPIINVFRIKPFKDALKQKALKLCRLFYR